MLEQICLYIMFLDGKACQDLLNVVHALWSNVNLG